MKLNSISQTIQRALSAAGLATSTGSRNANGTVNGNAAEIRRVIERALGAAGVLPRAGAPAAAPPVVAKDEAGPHAADTGEFLAQSHTGPQGTLAYKLFVPSHRNGRAMPLMVMLHGCKQNPDDFAAGTRMNELARQHGFLVAYPAQTSRANGANCWNWFEPAQQDRDGKEPSLIAGIVQDVTLRYPVQTGQVFLAGLSAGAAMALILASAYPEIFAGVAAHSGLPVGAAHDVVSAFAAMHGHGAQTAAGHRRPAPVRTLVFHGNADKTVTLGNGVAIARQAVAAYEAEGQTLRQVKSGDVESGGRLCNTTTFFDDTGKALVEEWVVQGASHAWFGGSIAGSYTDAGGPDASAEILRFFLPELRHAEVRR